MKASLTLALICLSLVACGRKDTIVLPAEPATATTPAKPERAPNTQPMQKSFFLDFLL